MPAPLASFWRGEVPAQQPWRSLAYARATGALLRKRAAVMAGVLRAGRRNRRKVFPDGYTRLVVERSSGFLGADHYSGGRTEERSVHSAFVSR